MEGIKGKKPCIFISSTCYDLSQVRQDIKDFIENDLGYNAILSEFKSFPLDPNIGTVENCLRVVNEQADLFVLVLGGRYGNITDNGKSVTNLEYIHARAKGIPIYIFILKPVLNLIPIWKDNPTIDVSSVSDSPKIFEFANQLYSEDDVWVHPFENSKDIVNILQEQFGYLLNDCLMYKNKIISSEFKSLSERIFGNALKIALEKPDSWEYLLFGELLKQGLNNSHDLRMDYKNCINIGKMKPLTDINNIIDWVMLKISEIGKYGEILAKLFNVTLQEAFGEDGVAGNARNIIYVAERVVHIYQAILNWALEFDSIYIDEEYENLLLAARDFSRELINDFERYVERYNKTLADALLLVANESEPIYIDLSWKLSNPPTEKLKFEMGKIKGISYLL